MMGLIKYTAVIPVRMRSPYHAADFWAQVAAGQLSDVANAGTDVEVLLDWRYTKLDPVEKDTRFTPSTPQGYAEVVSHGFREGWNIQLDWVEEVRDYGLANDFQALRSLNDHLRRGQVLWYPDFENYPDESVWCIADKIHAPRRTRNLKIWSFSFDLMQLPAAQAPSNLPSFVTV